MTAQRLVALSSLTSRVTEQIPHEQQQLALLTERHKSDQKQLEQHRKLLTETERRHAVLERQLYARLRKGKLITSNLQQLAVDEKETTK